MPSFKDGRDLGWKEKAGWKYFERKQINDHLNAQEKSRRFWSSYLALAGSPKLLRGILGKKFKRKHVGIWPEWETEKMNLYKRGCAVAFVLISQACAKSFFLLPIRGFKREGHDWIHQAGSLRWHTSAGENGWTAAQKKCLVSDEVFQTKGWQSRGIH